jgi:hypothetical protein
MKLATAGQAHIKHELKKTGRDAHVITEPVGDFKPGERTISVGPFTTDDVHARVCGGMRITMSENYYSVSVDVQVNIPVPPTPEGVQEGLDWCFAKASECLNNEAKGARKALKALARHEL